MIGHEPILLVFSFVLVTTFLPIGQGELDLYQPFLDCVDGSSCGNLQLKYPFADSNLPSYCRHPGFEVHCEEPNLILKIDGWEFRVLDIDGEKQLITLETVDILNNICPETSNNYSFNDGNFSISENTMAVNLLSSVSCQNPPSRDEDAYTCNNNSSPRVYFLSLIDNRQNNSDDCQPTYEVLMLKKAVAEFSSNKIAAAGALKQGFELSWAAVDMSWCPGCELTSGACGYNASLARFNCFCFDGSHQFNCSYPLNDHEFDGPLKKGKIVQKKFLIVGVSVATSLVILAVAISIIVYRRRIEDGHCANFKEVTSPTYPVLVKFEYNELREATDYFEKVVGSGANNNVHHGILKDGREVAVKRMFGRRDEQFMNELDLLARLHHQNLVDLYGYCSNDDINMLVYEYISNGTLSDHICGEGERTKEFLSWSDRLNIAIEIASTLVYLHASNVVHCDVKSDNILIDHNLSAKLADFGISRLLPDNTTHLTTTAQGTDGYTAPECDGRRRCRTTNKRDVFNFGVVLMELISSKPVTGGIDEYFYDMAMEMIDNDQLEELVDQRLWSESDTVKKNMIEDVARLGYECLQYNRDERPDLEYVLQRLKVIRDGKTEEDGTNTTDPGSGASSVLSRSHSFPGATTIIRSSSYTTSRSRPSI